MTKTNMKNQQYTKDYDEAINLASLYYNKLDFEENFNRNYVEGDKVYLTWPKYVDIMTKIKDRLAVSKIKYNATPEQFRACLTQADIVLVDAGPGTGKTTTMVVKIFSDKIILGYRGSEIRVLTYTRASAEDMNKRFTALKSVFNIMDFDVPISTIHKFAKDYLKRRNPHLRILSDSGIEVAHNEDEDEFSFEDAFSDDVSYDTSKTYTPRSIINDIIEKPEFAPFKWDLIPVKERILGWISLMSERYIKTEKEFNKLSEFAEHGKITFNLMSKIIKEYKEEKRKLNCIDFNDMLEIFLSDLQSLDSTADAGSAEYIINLRKIYVDESQDTSPIQINILKELKRLNKNCKFFFIGDIDQSIYSFRGADMTFMYKFDEIFLEDNKSIDGIKSKVENIVEAENRKEYTTDLIYLTINRRCPESVLKLSNELIKNNYMRNPKVVKGLGKEGILNTYIDPTGALASKHLINAVKDEVKKSNSVSNHAILYREHSQAYPIILSMIRNRISFNVNSKFSLNKIDEFKDLLGLVNLILSPSKQGIENFMYKAVPNITKKDALKISINTKTNNYKYGEYLKTYSPATYETFTWLHKALNSDTFTMQQIATVLVELYLKGFYEKHLDNGFGDAHRLAFVQQYLTSVPHESFDEFLQRYETDSIWVEKNSNNGGGVTFKTLHTSKGLEFEHVYLIGVGDDRMPKQKMVEKLSSVSGEAVDMYIEEERRLLYVGVTRAIKTLNIYLTDRESRFPKEIIKSASELGWGA